jgi:DNA-binding PadR family transcriptional regulator
MKGDLLRGHLDLFLLSIIASRPTHGYALISELKRRSRGKLDLAEGTVYPALYRLERGGFIKSRLVRPSGERERRLYSLTTKGRARARAEKTSWLEFIRTAQSILECGHA